MKVFHKISNYKNQIAVLVDPDKINSHENLSTFAARLKDANIDFIFIGGSTFVVAEIEEL